MARWYVIQVRTGQEASACSLVGQLVPDGALGRAFVPRREVMRHIAGQWVAVQEVLFPGYLFVEARDPARLSEELAKVPAYTRLLGAEGAFAPIADEERGAIASLMGEDHLVRMSQGVVEGDEVRILRGPLRGYEAVIEKVDRHKRAAYVRMRVLGRDALVKLGLEVLGKNPAS